MDGKCKFGIGFFLVSLRYRLIELLSTYRWLGDLLLLGPLEQHLSWYQ